MAASQQAAAAPQSAQQQMQAAQQALSTAAQRANDNQPGPADSAVGEAASDFQGAIASLAVAQADAAKTPQPAGPAGPKPPGQNDNHGPGAPGQPPGSAQNPTQNPGQDPSGQQARNANQPGVANEENPGSQGTGNRLPGGRGVTDTGHANRTDVTGKFINLPQRDRAALNQSEGEKYPQQYGRMVEGYRDTLSEDEQK